MSFFSPVPSGGSRRRTLTVLDVGTSKICCMIAKLKPSDHHEVLPSRTHEVKVVGFGHHKSDGVKGGVVTNLEAAERAIRQSVAAAETMSGLTAESLIVSLSAGKLKSENFTAEIDLGGHMVEPADVARVVAAGARASAATERCVVHSLPTGFRLDEEGGIVDPTAMVGDRLGVDLHVLTGDAAPMRNLEICINRAHLSVERVVATPYASALASLVGDEAQIGAACIDIGAGTTSIAVFANGRFVHAEAIAIGGHHVTMDLARGLHCSIEDAERLKVIQGSALPSAADDREIITVTPLGEGRSEPLGVPRSLVTKIVRARTEEMLETIRDRLAASGYASTIGKRIVLTGGGSQLSGLPEVARRILARNVRLGRPLGISGLPDIARGPAFATAVGLLIYPQVAEFELNTVDRSTPLFLAGSAGRLARVGQWIRNSF